MNYLSFLFLVFFTCEVCEAQNLVPNGDFEQNTNCPSAGGQLDNAIPWFNAALLTPDYFNLCATNSDVSVPTNVFGIQPAYSANAYAGFYCMQAPLGINVREYVCVQLTQTLQAGVTYYIQFYVSLADYSEYATTTIGAYLSDTYQYSMTGYLVNHTPQILNTTAALTDKTNWMPISGTYTASGNERYILIGCFNDDSNCGLQYVTGGNLNLSYYYIDDVLVTSSTLVHDWSVFNQVIISPNPFSDKINITLYENQLLEINIYDFASRNILNLTFSNSTSINTKQLANGVYFYEVRNKNGVVKKGKIVKD